MDFDDTPEEAEFRAEAAVWLKENGVPKQSDQSMATRRGDPKVVPRAREWNAKKFEGGFAGISLPKKYGGRGGTLLQQIIFNQEESNYAVPPNIFSISHGMAVPTLLTYATEEQKQELVPATLKGDEIWCQLFSEPGAGSDLAGLRTRSERCGDDWVINGQKIWTSGAHYADRAILVTRNDPEAVKHRGLTYFFLDMKTPGIDVRPIRQVSGYSGFNEVFLTDVRIPDSQRLGNVGEGWQVAITTLMNERVVSGDKPAPNFDEIFSLAQQLDTEEGPAIEDKAVRDRLAKWYIQTRGIELIRMRSMTAMSRGERPGPENSIGKLVASFKRQDIAQFGMDLMDMGGIMQESQASPMSGLFQNAYLESPGSRIAAGTDETMRNILAERVLKLPREPRADKDVPFNELKAGTVRSGD